MKKRMARKFYFICLVLTDNIFGVQQSITTFYRSRNLYLKGDLLGSQEVHKETECLGLCMNKKLCKLFNVVEVGKNAKKKCEFLKNSKCGVIRETPKSSAFYQQKTCSFELYENGKNTNRCFKEDTVEGHNKKIVKGANDVPGKTRCAEFQINLDGSGLKINGKSVYTELLKPENPIKYLMLDREHHNMVRLMLVWDEQFEKFYIKEKISNTCVAMQQDDAEKHLVLEDCTAHNTYFRMEEISTSSKTINTSGFY